MICLNPKSSRLKRVSIHLSISPNTYVEEKHQWPWLQLSWIPNTCDKYRLHYDPLVTPWITCIHHHHHPLPATSSNLVIVGHINIKYELFLLWNKWFLIHSLLVFWLLDIRHDGCYRLYITCLDRVHSSNIDFHWLKAFNFFLHHVDILEWVVSDVNIRW